MRATSTAKAIPIIPIINKPNPNAIPIDQENHTLAAVVRLVTLLSSSLFRMSPAPRNPIPVTILAAILDVEVGSTRPDIYEKIIEPPMTRHRVLIPAGLPLDSLSRPITKPARNDKPNPIRN